MRGHTLCRAFGKFGPVKCGDLTVDLRGVRQHRYDVQIASTEGVAGKGMKGIRPAGRDKQRLAHPPPRHNLMVQTGFGRQMARKHRFGRVCVKVDLLDLMLQRQCFGHFTARDKPLSHKDFPKRCIQIALRFKRVHQIGLIDQPCVDQYAPQGTIAPAHTRGTGCFQL